LWEKLFDLLYWGSASVLVFSMIHEKNSGVIRGYSVLGMLAGMIFYRLAAKDRLVLGAQRRSEKLRKWCSAKWEPVRKKKKELQNRRKQSKIEHREKKRSLAEARRDAKQKRRAAKKARAASRRAEKKTRKRRREAEE
ncbi:MAG: spore cortex biosynthesis protein YabQ, partial [Lachnospiraceae bacterium]|nr:spore cortex biosynthesis protein YabQ [Lachnospiraceae bacterium]